ncbi:MAG TPA: CHAT domain-containing protein [Chryseosolibacter sp.]|nr:CHAT domain-containing protein [Chryseosolibacter sp.]
MRKILLVAFYLPVIGACAQSIVKVDSLLLAASYDQALQLTAAIPPSATSSEKVLLATKRAQALIHLGRYDEADSTLTGIPVGDNTYHKAIVLTTSGLLFMNQGRLDRAQETLEQAVSAFESTGKGTSLDAAQAITYLGLSYNSAGRYMKAQEQLMMALSIREKNLTANHELVAASLNDLGLAYANTDNDKALDYYEKAFRIYAAIHGPDHPKLAIASINNGLIYRKLELYGDAVNNFEAALKIWERAYQGPHPTKAFALLNLGETYLKMQNLDAARGYYEKALQMYRGVYGDKHPDIAQVLNALGNIALSNGKYADALNLYQQAIIANVSGYEDPAPASLPPPDRFYNGHVLLYSLLYKAQAYEEQYAGKSLRLSDLITSLRILQHCDSLVNSLRQHSTNENDKIALGVIANDVYANGVRIAMQTALNSVRRKPYFELAFYFAEKSKSAVLLESISEANAKSFAGIPTALMEEEKNLKSAIALTNRKLSQKPSPDEERLLRETAFKLSRAYESFIRKLESDFPQYFNLKFNTTSPSMQDLQKLLDKETAVLSYFIDDKGGRLYTFLITAKRYKVFERTLPAEFDRYITGFRNGIYFNELKSFSVSGRKLHDLLIPARIPAAINQLVILPTGRLSVIPFEALLSRKANSQDFRQLPYLIKDYSVRYEFSASLLLEKSLKRGTLANRSIFLCAPVTFGDSKLPELPGTESEVKEISKMFSDRQLTCSVKLYDQADEGLIKGNAADGFHVVHLATHGVVDEYHPELSRIYLKSTDGRNDGSLFSGEIYNLKLNANLVTLSACQTGLGKISKGEGVIGLSRALVFAGAKNIVVSYWSVSDESTAQLMKDFYRTLLDGSDSYASSLRLAKKNLIATERFAAPYYWAPFILIGF